MTEPVAHAYIVGDLVTNMILVGDDYEPPEGVILLPAPEGVGIGWGYVDGEWVAPPEPEPPVS